MANISKLNSDQISEMRRLFEEGATQKFLAERYGVSITTVVNKLKAKPKEEPPGISTFSTDTVEALRQLDLREREAEAEVEAVLEAVRKKKEPPKRRIVGVNV